MEGSVSHQALFDYYNSGIEEERLVRNHCNRLEYEATLHVLEPYIPPQARLLEVGAGYGRYAIHYARQGYQVTAVELIPAQVASIRAKIAGGETGDLVVYEADACDLHMIADGAMDVVLCLGPLYHLQAERDRLRCVQEALRVLKPGGSLAAAYINRFLMAALIAKRNPALIQAGFLGDLREQGLVLDERFDPFNHAAYYATPDEMESLIAQAGAEIVDHIGVDGVAKLIEQIFNEMDEAAYQQWFRYHLSICRERSVLGYSTHGLVICRKD
jgi:SAM-dependent methyltransferase